MTIPVRSAAKAARLLAEVYAGSQGEAYDVDPVTEEELARAMNANPVYLEATWNAWVSELEGLYGWTRKEIDDARYWLDAAFLGGLPVP